MSNNQLKVSIDSEYSTTSTSLRPRQPRFTPTLKSSTKLLDVSTQRSRGSGERGGENNSISGERGERSGSFENRMLSYSVEGEELSVTLNENNFGENEWVMESCLRDSLSSVSAVIEDFISFFRDFGDPNDGIAIENALGKFKSVDDMKDMILYRGDDFERLECPVYVKRAIIEYINPQIKTMEPVVIDHRDLIGRTGENEISLSGKNLNLIEQVGLVLTHETIPVDFDILSHNKINLMFTIEPTVKTSLYKLSFVTTLNTEIDIEILIRGASNPLVMRRVDKEETMKFLANHFVWNGKCHEIIFAPDLTKCVYRDEEHVNQRDIHGATDLIYAIKGQRTQIIDYLLSLNIDVSLPTYKSEYPLHFAAEKGDLITIKKLLEKGAQIDVENDIGESPKDYAEKNRRTETVAFLSSHSEHQ